MFRVCWNQAYSGAICSPNQAFLKSPFITQSQSLVWVHELGSNAVTFAGEEQSDVGVDEEASGAEMQDSNWTNSPAVLSTVTVSVSRLNRRAPIALMHGNSGGRVENTFPNSSSGVWSQSPAASFLRKFKFFIWKKRNWPNWDCGASAEMHEAAGMFLMS